MRNPFEPPALAALFEAPTFASEVAVSFMPGTPSRRR
jgi:hypothetical protein